MQPLAIILGVLVTVSSVNAATLSDCDSTYAKRGLSSLQAGQCYQSLLSGTSLSAAEQKTIYTRAFIALSATINDQPKTAAERQAIDQGLSLLKEFAKGFSTTADFFYWRACMMSFDVFQKDRDSIIPTNTFGVLGSIQDDLTAAIQRDQSIHFYGPLRVMGMMHTQMPAIIGGDKVFAEKMLKEAYSRAPVFSMNHLAYAKILDINSKTDLAMGVLKNLIQTPNETFNPYPDQPLLSLLPEVIKDKKAAAELLQNISE